MSIYLDHAATTPIDPRVKEAMDPYLVDAFGNPSSIHTYGRDVRAAIDVARETIARSIHAADPSEIVFTSGGTEADNMALRGVMVEARSSGKKHLITSQIEHHAILDTCEYLEKLGFEVTYVPVDSFGRVYLQDIQNAIRPDTALISIMFGNNEIGTLQPIREIGEFAREREILFHVDAVQSLGLEEINVGDLPIDLMSISAHKIYGPKGIGALYVHKKVKMMPQMFGGYQERKRRAGTENVPGIIGFAKAVELRMQERERYREHLKQLRDELFRDLKVKQIDFVQNGHAEQSLLHIVNLSFPGIDSETLLMNLDIAGIAVSSGSACTSGTIHKSHVIEALQVGEERADSAIRFSFGQSNTIKEISYVVNILRDTIQRLSRT
ncbi:cysteine desulfurase family protein [Thermoactinomyces sp. DSM 45892]|uniref:cysteine desulfurase family protein n=1 Tax=Thermoactinomyces sp. DSM 45892 TaxID=1882753 RepID=UPI00089C1824|nr:cysteine desulfurase family protein [Thermoactinomyces sp. DSM 45892]SDY30665.1 cysteine desulfurase [Thermoactinomyces sp. DSM 45892]